MKTPFLDNEWMMEASQTHAKVWADRAEISIGGDLDNEERIAFAHAVAQLPRLLNTCRELLAVYYAFSHRVPTSVMYEVLSARIPGVEDCFEERAAGVIDDVAGGGEIMTTETANHGSAHCYRPEWWPQDKYGCNAGSLLVMAETLHGVFTGAVEPVKEQNDLYAKCLRWALNNWKVPECEFDVYVRMLCGRALVEYGQHVARSEELLRLQDDNEVRR
jgi:hypothetical protein